MTQSYKNISHNLLDEEDADQYPGTIKEDTDEEDADQYPGTIEEETDEEDQCPDISEEETDEEDQCPDISEEETDDNDRALPKSAKKKEKKKEEEERYENFKRIKSEISVRRLGKEEREDLLSIIVNVNKNCNNHPNNAEEEYKRAEEEYKRAEEEYKRAEEECQIVAELKQRVAELKQTVAELKQRAPELKQRADDLKQRDDEEYQRAVAKLQNDSLYIIAREIGKHFKYIAGHFEKISVAFFDFMDELFGICTELLEKEIKKYSEGFDYDQFQKHLSTRIKNDLKDVLAERLFYILTNSQIKIPAKTIRRKKEIIGAFAKFKADNGGRAPENHELVALFPDIKPQTILKLNAISFESISVYQPENENGEVECIGIIDKNGMIGYKAAFEFEKAERLDIDALIQLAKCTDEEKMILQAFKNHVEKPIKINFPSIAEKLKIPMASFEVKFGALQKKLDNLDQEERSYLTSEEKRILRVIKDEEKKAKKFNESDIADGLNIKRSTFADKMKVLRNKLEAAAKIHGFGKF